MEATWKKRARVLTVTTEKAPGIAADLRFRGVQLWLVVTICKSAPTSACLFVPVATTAQADVSTPTSGHCALLCKYLSLSETSYVLNLGVQSITQSDHTQ